MTVNKLKEAFFSLKISRSPSCDDINFNVVRNCFDPLIKPLMIIFNLSLEQGHFLEELKIACVTPIHLFFINYQKFKQSPRKSQIC